MQSWNCAAFLEKKKEKRSKKPNERSHRDTVIKTSSDQLTRAVCQKQFPYCAYSSFALKYLLHFCLKSALLSAKSLGGALSSKMKRKKTKQKTSTQLTSTIALKNTVTVTNTHSVNVAIAQGASIHSAVPLNGRVVSRKPRKSVQGSCGNITLTFSVALHEQPIMLRCVFGQ